MDREAAAILTQSKSVGTAVVLTLFFGGLGLLYATVKGGVIMLIVDIVCLLSLLIGIGLVLIPIARVVSVIVAVNSVQAHNRRLISGVGVAVPPAVASGGQVRES